MDEAVSPPLREIKVPLMGDTLLGYEAVHLAMSPQIPAERLFVRSNGQLRSVIASLLALSNEALRDHKRPAAWLCLAA